MRLTALFLIFAACGHAVVVDRIAVIANKKAIKDTDIERDIRLTCFLNGDPLALGLEDRKKAARRLIDQQIIRREVELGEYPTAKPDEVEKFLATVLLPRFSGEAALNESLARYGVSGPDLRRHLQWQLTVLNFIDQRFRPAVIVPDADVEAYAKEHGVKAEDAREQLNGQKVNEAFEAWLNGAERRADIVYREEDLK
jgi:hypothetical protein